MLLWGSAVSRYASARRAFGWDVGHACFSSHHRDSEGRFQVFLQVLVERCRARAHVLVRFSASHMTSNFRDPKITSAPGMVLLIEVPRRFGGGCDAFVRSLSNLFVCSWACNYFVRRIATALFHKDLQKNLESPFRIAMIARQNGKSFVA